jgi:SAM-dependent methyltransferase
MSAAKNLRKEDLPTNQVQMSRWETRKLPQIEWMCKLIIEILREHPAYGRRKLSILDVGGGKGMLAHHLSRAIENIEINVVDIGAGAIRNGETKGIRLRKGKEKLPLSVVNFHVADASISKLEKIDADVVVALHACGHLTDVALYHAYTRQASFVIVPCCFKSNTHLTIPDGTSTGTGTLVHTWLGIPEDDWTQLKAIAEIQGDVATSLLGMQLLNAIRCRSMQRKMYGRGDSEPAATNLKIVSFPIEYSTRNMALVGRC